MDSTNLTADAMTLLETACDAGAAGIEMPRTAACRELAREQLISLSRGRAFATPLGMMISIRNLTASVRS